MMVDKANNSVSFQGTQKGVDLLYQRPDICIDFVKFSNGMFVY